MDKAMTEPRLRPTLAALTIADTNRPTGPAVEQGIFSPEIQIGIVEQQPDRNRTNLPALGFPESLIKRMWQPAVCTLNLAGDGELIVLLRKTFAGLLDDLANGNPSSTGGVMTRPFNMIVPLK
jgi:hypothetical protein